MNGHQREDSGAKSRGAERRRDKPSVVANGGNNSDRLRARNGDSVDAFGVKGIT